MFDVLYHKSHDYTLAFEQLLEFLVADHLPGMIAQFDGKLEWLLEDEDVYGRIVGIYRENFEAIHADTYDYLGDMYVEMQGRFSQGIKGQYLTPPQICDFMTRMTLGVVDRDRPLNILDPCVGTGRFLIAAGKYAPEAVLYGIDIDNRAIRTAFANACIHKLRMRLLNADSLAHATDWNTDAGRYNWKYCNHWQSHYNDLKSIVDEFSELKKTKKVPEKTALPEYKQQKAVQLNLFDYVGK